MVTSWEVVVDVGKIASELTAFSLTFLVGDDDANDGADDTDKGKTVAATVGNSLLELADGNGAEVCEGVSGEAEEDVSIAGVGVAAVAIDAAAELPICVLAAAGVVRVGLSVPTVAATTEACGFEEDEVVETTAALPIEEKIPSFPPRSV